MRVRSCPYPNGILFLNNPRRQGDTEGHSTGTIGVAVHFPVPTSSLVGEGFVRFRQLHEKLLVSGLLVWMVLERQLVIRFLDLTVCRTLELAVHQETFLE